VNGIRDFAPRARPPAPKDLTELELKARSIKRLETPEDLIGTLVFSVPRTAIL